jgi:ABC-type phosphate/phosphonate transport system substrate-binding protein
MVSPTPPPQKCLFRYFCLAIVLACLSAARATVVGQETQVSVLRIGSTGTLTGDAASSKEKAGLETLRTFIKEESGLDSEIAARESWQDLTAKMAKGQFHLGVFQGHEFAWAQEKHPDLKPLALAVNTHRYPIVCILARRDNPAKDFSGLKGQSLALPVTAPSCLRLFVERRSEAAGHKAEVYFSKITVAENAEDALDHLVDGTVQAVAVDRVAVDAYQRRKPGRFKQLKEVARSQEFPPMVIAYYGSVLDETLRGQLKDGLLGAARKEKAEMVLTLAHLTAFEEIPEGFGRVLAETRKAYPAPAAKKD